MHRTTLDHRDSIKIDLSLFEKGAIILVIHYSLYSLFKIKSVHLENIYFDLFLLVIILLLNLWESTGKPQMRRKSMHDLITTLNHLKNGVHHILNLGVIGTICLQTKRGKLWSA